jgi:GMP synthase-like glutamine amidotransferase
MKPILIIRHVAHEGPGYLADFLEQRSVSFRVAAIDSGAEIPTTADANSAIVFMGGPMSVNDELPWIAPAMSLIQTAIKQHIPLLGHCLGGQLIARALGAPVRPNPVPEYGWLPVRVSDNTEAKQWFAGVDEEFMAFHWHGETFDLPNGATHVLASEACHNQAFVIDNTLAMQCHIEMTPALLKEWIARADDTALTATGQSKQAILSDLDSRITSLQDHAERIYSHWLTLVTNRQQQDN